MAFFVSLTPVNVAATLVAAAAAVAQCCIIIIIFTAVMSAALYDLNKQLDACEELTTMAETLLAKLIEVLMTLLQMS